MTEMQRRRVSDRDKRRVEQAIARGWSVDRIVTELGVPGGVVRLVVALMDEAAAE